jgi:hypothetical protein
MKPGDRDVLWTSAAAATPRRSQPLSGFVCPHFSCYSAGVNKCSLLIGFPRALLCP